MEESSGALHPTHCPLGETQTESGWFPGQRVLLKRRERGWEHCSTWQHEEGKDIPSGEHNVQGRELRDMGMAGRVNSQGGAVVPWKRGEETIVVD